MNLLNWLGYEKVKKKGRSGGSIISRWINGVEHLNPKDQQSMVDAYKHWIYICANKNANAVAKQPLKLYVAKKDKNYKCLQPTREISRKEKDYLRENHYNYYRKAVVIEEVVNHPFLDLIKNVNPYTNYTDFIFLTQLYKELTGNNYWYMNLNGFGQPKELWTLPAQRTSIVPSKADFIKGYVYTREDGEKIPLTKNEIVHFKFPNPNDMYYGASPVMAAATSYNLRENADKYENALFTNMGRPEGYFTTEQSLGEVEFERLQKQLKDNWGGVRNAGKDPLFENGLEYKYASIPPRDLSYVELRKMGREEIATIFGVPMSKLITEDVNKANAETGGHDYEADTIQPRLQALAEEINEAVLPLYDDKIFCAFENPVREDAKIKLEKNVKYATVGIYTRNEIREEEGKQPIQSIEGLEGLDIPLTPSNTIAMGQENPNKDNQSPKKPKKPKDDDK